MTFLKKLGDKLDRARFAAYRNQTISILVAMQVRFFFWGGGVRGGGVFDVEWLF